MAKTETADMIEPVVRVSVTDQVFNTLYSSVLSLRLPPGTKMSEAIVAKQLDVSRQVVRDAFYRLSVLGFLTIRPQRATVVSHISARRVFEARYVRTAIEIENVKRACTALTSTDFDELEEILKDQKTAIDSGEIEVFHRHDNEFHETICKQAGLGFTWATIQEKKAHTDRVRFLSLAFSLQFAFDGHVEILAALRSRDQDRAAMAMRRHLSQIESAIQQLKEENHEWFIEEADPKHS